MIEKKTFAIAEVKSAPSDNANGEFEIIMSTDSLDRLFLEETKQFDLDRRR